MAFTALDVKKLREQTGCGMMDCKKALTESDGDFDKAVEYLREKGLAAAANKASGLCGMCAKAFISHLANHCLMNNSFVIVYAKDAVIQLYFAGFLAGDIIQLYFRH